MSCGGPRCITLQNSSTLGQAVAEISRFFDFSKWRPSAILDLFAVFLDHPQAYLVVFTGVQFLVGIHAVVWIIWQFEYFTRLVWKCLFAPPKIMVLGDFTPSMERYINRTSILHILAWKDVIWCIDCQNWSTDATYAQLCMFNKYATETSGG